MNMNRKLKNRFAQTTAIALTAVMMSSQAVGAQASVTDTEASSVEAETVISASTTAGYTSALAESQPDEVSVTLNLQGDAMFSGMENAVNKVAEEKAAEEEAARIAAEEEAARVAAEKAAAAEAAQAATQTTTQQATATTGESVAATADDVTLLAALIQCEAGGECYEGQVAVGAVVVNRLHAGYSNSIYGVIYQRGQFGPASSGKVARVIASGVSGTAYSAASEALAGVDYTGGAKNFQPASTGRGGTVIGNHVFY